jgi:dipeptidyl aminopeptidase/acylaminoacyl peptidase
MKRIVLGAAMAAWFVVLGAGVSAYAATPATTLIPVEDFTRMPKMRSVTFSPDGRLFGAVQELDGRMNLTVGDIKTGKLTRLTSFTTYDVSSYRWISSKRLTFSVYDSTKGLAEQRGGGMYAINADGTDRKDLNCPDTGPTCRPAQFMQRIWGSDEEILATANERDIKTEDVYRLNTRTGRKTLLTTDNPGNVKEWFLDKDGVPRAATSKDDRKLGETFWYRDSASTPWRKISSVVNFEKRIKPAAFDADGSLFVYSNLNSDKYQIFVLDTATGKPGELIAAHPLVDLDTETARPMIRLRDHKILGFRVNADKPELLWLDEDYAKLQAVVDGSLPKGHENDISTLDDGRVLVNSWSDRDPGASYLYDPKAKQMQELLRPIDWIKPEQMSPMQVVRYKARDGLEIPAYLTIPQGKPAKKLPLVAWIHGGPWVRDDWHFSNEVQFLASRGYAVFQPNYRGSTGFGEHHLTSSFKQYGQSMQDDITDGIRYLIAQGIVDPDRVCIGGGSYGGYATMMGLVKEPEMFRCGIDEAGVTDLIWAQELGYTDFNSGDAEAAEAWYKITSGDVKTDRALLEQYSPRLHADKIKAPVLIVHGGGDRRVPIKHAEGMRDALKAAGKEYEWVIYPEEGHGFTKPENQIDRFKKIEAFLHKNLAPGKVIAGELKQN